VAERAGVRRRGRCLWRRRDAHANRQTHRAPDTDLAPVPRPSVPRSTNKIRATRHRGPDTPPAPRRRSARRVEHARYLSEHIPGASPSPDGVEPEFSVYLLERIPGPFEWDHRWVRWPDFRTPTSTDDVIAVLAKAYRRSASERVELACGGGVGRTGTALAAIAVLAGVPRPEAVAWVRRRYNRRAVETPWQRRWVLKVDLAD